MATHGRLRLCTQISVGLFVGSCLLGALPSVWAADPIPTATPVADDDEALKVLLGEKEPERSNTQGTAAQNAQKEDREVRLGSIAGSTGGSTVDYVGSDPYGVEVNTISGSVSRQGDGWLMKVFNNGKERYNVTVEVIQLDAKGTRLRSRTSSFSLSSKQVKEERLSLPNDVASCSVNLLRVKKL